MAVRNRQIPPKKYQKERRCSGTVFFRATAASSEIRKRSSRNLQTSRRAGLAISVLPRNDDVGSGDGDRERLERARRRPGQDVPGEIEAPVMAGAEEGPAFGFEADRAGQMGADGREGQERPVGGAHQ